MLRIRKNERVLTRILGEENKKSRKRNAQRKPYTREISAHKDSAPPLVSITNVLKAAIEEVDRNRKEYIPKIVDVVQHDEEILKEQADFFASLCLNSKLKCAMKKKTNWTDAQRAEYLTKDASEWLKLAHGVVCIQADTNKRLTILENRNASFYDSIAKRFLLDQARAGIAFALFLFPLQWGQYVNILKFMSKNEDRTTRTITRAASTHIPIGIVTSKSKENKRSAQKNRHNQQLGSLSDFLADAPSSVYPRTIRILKEIIAGFPEKNGSREYIIGNEEKLAELHKKIRNERALKSFQKERGITADIHSFYHERAVKKLYPLRKQDGVIDSSLMRTEGNYAAHHSSKEDIIACISRTEEKSQKRLLSRIFQGVQSEVDLL